MKKFLFEYAYWLFIEYTYSVLFKCQHYLQKAWLDVVTVLNLDTAFVFQVKQEMVFNKCLAALPSFKTQWLISQSLGNNKENKDTKNRFSQWRDSSVQATCEICQVTASVGKKEPKNPISWTPEKRLLRHWCHKYKHPYQTQRAPRRPTHRPECKTLTRNTMSSSPDLWH